ncbi:MAG: hypothetical protein SFU99_15790 [Saprospiraceae bacterium]|nr:hypothetical protein [Saprospiraceae bacterium]
MKRTSIASIILLLPFLSEAHEGHGQFHADDIRHYWGSLEHLIPIAIMGLVLALILFQIVKLVNKKSTEKVNDK